MFITLFNNVTRSESSGQWTALCDAPLRLDNPSCPAARSTRTCLCLHPTSQRASLFLSLSGKQSLVASRLLARPGARWKSAGNKQQCATSQQLQLASRHFTKACAPGSSCLDASKSLSRVAIALVYFNFHRFPMILRCFSGCAVLVADWRSRP